MYISMITVCKLHDEIDSERNRNHRQGSKFSRQTDWNKGTGIGIELPFENCVAYWIPSKAETKEIALRFTTDLF